MAADCVPAEFNIANSLLEIELLLANKLNALSFGKPISYVYNPIDYAYDIHSKFVTKFCSRTKRILFLGMNPGPWGMSQTGVPFGEVNVVREWFRLSGTVNRPKLEHPERPVMGLSCKRSEISGRKFWGLFQEICVDPHTFFRHSFVYNHCPFAFLSETGKNITPADLKAGQRKEMIKLCDEALCNVVNLLQVEIIIGIGKFAERRANEAFKSNTSREIPVIYSIPHPSPRNSGAKDWKESTLKQLDANNLMQFFVNEL